jgi:hypothetical protein
MRIRCGIRPDPFLANGGHWKPNNLPKPSVVATIVVRYPEPAVTALTRKVSGKMRRMTIRPGPMVERVLPEQRKHVSAVRMLRVDMKEIAEGPEAARPTDRIPIRQHPEDLPATKGNASIQELERMLFTRESVVARLFHIPTVGVHREYLRSEPLRQ